MLRGAHSPLSFSSKQLSTNKGDKQADVFVVAFPVAVAVHAQCCVLERWWWHV